MRPLVQVKYFLLKSLNSEGALAGRPTRPLLRPALLSIYLQLNIKKNRDRINKCQQHFLNSEPSTSSNNLSAFNTDLCRILIHADIPIFKLKNREFSDFLEKYTGQQIPDKSTNRMNNVNIIYEETLKSIKQFIQDGLIYYEFQY